MLNNNNNELPILNNNNEARILRNIKNQENKLSEQFNLNYSIFDNN